MKEQDKKILALDPKIFGMLNNSQCGIPWQSILNATAKQEATEFPCTTKECPLRFSLRKAISLTLGSLFKPQTNVSCIPKNLNCINQKDK